MFDRFFKQRIADETESKAVFYQDMSVKVTEDGIWILGKFYPISGIQNVFFVREAGRPVWIRLLLCLAALIVAIGMAVEYVGKGPVGFLMVMALIMPPLIIGGGAVYGILYPAYGLYFETFLDKYKVFESRSVYQAAHLKKAILKSRASFQQKEAEYTASGKIVNFF